MNGRTAAVLLDVEGTTTPVDFVYRILFPYSYERLPAFLEARRGEATVLAVVDGLREEHRSDVAAGRQPPSLEMAGGVAGYARWLIDQDRKATPLKTLQGLIWEEGFLSGDLRGQVYDDVPQALARWQAEGQKVAIFSSGSVLAQRLLFANSDHGDLSGFLSAYFDTTTGPKRVGDSYRTISRALGVEPGRVLFVSDVVEELDAARSAGLETALCVREGPLPSASTHRLVRSFEALGSTWP